MNKKFKAALLIALLTAFLVLLLIPVKTYSTTHYPGRMILGPNGDTCLCPSAERIQCGCAMDLIPE